ncbi:unnamed protein product, partial [Polarella glacialis]
QRQLRRIAEGQEAREKQQRRQSQQQALEAFRTQQREEEEQLAARMATAKAEQRLSEEDKTRIAERNEAMVRQKELQRRRREEQQQRSTQSFQPPTRAGPSAYAHVHSKLQGHTEAYVDRARDFLDSEEQQRAGAASKYGVVPGNFAHQGIVRTLRASPSWRPGFGS